MPTSSFSYFGFTNSEIFSGASISRFDGLPYIDYIVKKEIVSDDRGFNSISSSRYLFPPIYTLVDCNGSRRVVQFGNFKLADIEANQDDFVTVIRIIEGKNYHRYIPSKSYSLSDITGIDLFKELTELFKDLNEAGSWSSYQTMIESQETKQSNKNVENNGAFPQLRVILGQNGTEG